MQQELLNFTYDKFNKLVDYELGVSHETVIEVDFEQEDSEKNMAIRKLNFTLCILLGLLIFITTISYYFATANEITLNKLSKETTVFNDENAELETQLDRLKSFNNVDKSMQKNNLLSKAKQVIEVQEVDDSTNVINKKSKDERVFNWAIGY
ncbi:hypothetical protein IJG72_00745 [bacterium]|nr:hypothetical protein [bacterium]